MKGRGMGPSPGQQQGTGPRARQGNSGGGGGGNRGGGGRRGGGNGRNPGNNNNSNRDDYSNLPLERGLVCTLKDSFGFIYCADRPEELFFHYSNVQGIHPADLKIDDAVEFRVSGGSGGGGSSSSSSSNNAGGQQQQTGNSARLAAVMIRPLPPGAAIIWESQDAPNRKFRGLVERSARARINNSNAAAVDGTIRVLEEKEDHENDNINGKSNDDGGGDNDQDIGNNRKATITASATGPLVRFRANEYPKPSAAPTPATEYVVMPPPVPGTNSRSQGLHTPPVQKQQEQQQQSLLRRGDLVEFEVWTERRTGDKYARNITVLQSEKELSRLAEEERLMKDATVEHGIITCLKGDYGFLKSNKRREEIYFHYSSIELEDDASKDGISSGGSDNKSSAADGDPNEEMILKEGQEMKFLVVTEAGGGGGRNAGSSGMRRVSARKVQMQPRGSVKFHDVLARGVTGTVSVPPQEVDTSHTLDMHGRIRLSHPLFLPHTGQDGDDFSDAKNDDSPKIVTEVFLSSKDSPGGSYSFRGGSSVGMWIQPGDTLLFDVVQDYVDGSCHASPTQYLKPRKVAEGESTNEPADDENALSENPPAVRLIGLALAMRSEGVVNAVKEAYGFVHYAERPVDVHFKLHQLLPEELQMDLRRNLRMSQLDERGRKLRLEVGAEVSFDLSVHGTIHSHVSSGSGSSGRHGHRGGSNSGRIAQPERENLKAQRVLLLPRHSIQACKTLAADIRGVIAKEEIKNPYSGAVDLDEAVQSMSLDQRHPLVARMIEQYLKLCNDETSRIHSMPPEPMIFHDIQSLKEDEIVLEMLDFKAKGLLTHYFLPAPEQESCYNGRLVIQPLANCSSTSKEAQTTQPDIRHCSTTEETPTKGLALCGSSAENETAAQLSADDVKVSPTASLTDGKQQQHSKKQRKTEKPIKTLRFDKGSLCPELKTDLPPVTGDIVAMDVIQSRRTGIVSISNMRMVERKAPSESVVEVPVSSPDGSVTIGMGVVAEVVTARNFGFITLFDETATKRELVFFHISSIVGPKEDVGAGKRGSPLVSKGDEVRFNLAKKNGKRVALNVTLLPKGTIPAKADKNACRGIILLEPTHTTLKNTPLRHVTSTASQHSSEHGGAALSRWHSTGDKTKATKEDTITGHGCVLLISDPSNMFSIEKPQERVAESSSTAGTATAAETTLTETSTQDDATAHDTGSEPESTRKEEESPSLLMKHLHYKHGSIAIHGSGSSSLTDDSSNPKRGDLVSFVKARNGKSVRDIRVVSRGGATLLQGKLRDIVHPSGTATFATDQQEQYTVSLSEIVGCDPCLLKEDEAVEAIVHEGKVYGICRIMDLYLNSKVASSGSNGGVGIGRGGGAIGHSGGGRGNGAGERPKLNLTVKKDRGGTIMAQSMMAKGPDGTNGFAPDWTGRISRYTTGKQSQNSPAADGSVQVTTSTSSTVVDEQP